MGTKRSFKKIISDLSVQIIIAMVVGVIVGKLMGESAVMFAPLGSLFIQLIRMLVIPLVFVSIVAGSASLGATKSAGRIGVTTLVYIFTTTVIAVLLAIMMGEWFKPGAGLSVDSIKSFLPVEGYNVAPQRMEFWPMLLDIIPGNPIKSLAEGNILQLIFFGLFFGFGLSALSTSKKEPILNAFNTFLDALIWCIQKVMLVAPIGVFGLMADATGTFGFDMLLKVGTLFWVNLIAAFIMLLIFYPLTLKLFSKIKLPHFLKSMLRPQVVAFSTSSSMATLPVTMATCEEKLGVSKETTSFVVPLGATINMTGNAIYYTLVALFFAQLYNIDLTLAQYIAITITATVGSVGQAGVPGPTLLVVAVLVSAGIPIEGLPLLYALDRVFDMLRTVLNITGDAACAVIVDKQTGKSK
ncbi:MAG: dicarboxylate/amino acid:cation symporter [Paludibacter sp.]|nr:dicarboxylate/amino acid:cation symporter [Paludibacter sp.]MDD4198035.1 dicarboxylate/amino acid:cation symporter [Paludibacter sp.]MDD4427010.1 dicarboxylate/amino acid:cation symporter [Paludibacter sp.]